MRSWYYERNELDCLDTLTLMIMFYNVSTPGGGGALGYVLGGYVPGTPNWHPVLKKISSKIDTPF